MSEISFGVIVHRQRHLSVQNDVRSFRRMRVIRIGRVRRVLPHISLTESLSLKSSHKFPFAHDMILSNIRDFRRKTATPSLRHWGTPQRGRVRLQERSSLYPRFSYLAEALPEHLLAIRHEISP
jgi:hypothetical protein